MVQVYLYVSASKRLVGCVMLQSISSACYAIPAEDAAASTGNSSACEPSSRAPLSALLQPTCWPVAAGLRGLTHESLPLRSGMFPSAGLAVSNTQVCFQHSASRQVLMCVALCTLACCNGTVSAGAALQYLATVLVPYA